MLLMEKIWLSPCARCRSFANVPIHALRSTSVARRHGQGASPRDNTHSRYHNLTATHLWHPMRIAALPLRALQHARPAASDMFRPYFHTGCGLQGLPLLIIGGFINRRHICLFSDSRAGDACLFNNMPQRRNWMGAVQASLFDDCFFVGCAG